MHRIALLLVATVPLLTPTRSEACSPVPDWAISNQADSIPADDETPFPHDASPLVRIGNLIRGEIGPDARPALFNVEDDSELAVSLETRLLFDGLGITEWIRVVPDDPLPAGERFVLRFTAEEGDDWRGQETVDSQFPPVEFITGRSFIEDEPVAPTPEIEVIDHPGTPAGISPCGAFDSNHEHSIKVYVDHAVETPGPHDIWRFFVVSDDLDLDDLENLIDRAAVDAALLDRDEDLVASWRYDAPDAANAAKCVIAVTEDAYGRTSEPSSEACAEPVAECVSGCSSTGDRAAGSVGLLSLLVLGLRRRDGAARRG